MTITEIAKKANVSPATVDRVLHNRGRVSAATVALVRDIIRESGFEPNQYARNLRLSKQYRFGILIREFENGGDGYWEILHDGCVAASKDMKSLSAQLVWEYFGDSPENGLYAAGMRLLEQNIDGLVVAPNSPEEVGRLLAEMNGIPYAFVNTGYPDASPVIDTSQDCFMAGGTVAKIMMMLKPGGRRFAVIRRESASNTAAQRAASFSGHFSGREDVSVRTCTINHAGGDIQRQLRRFLSEHGELDGIFITNTCTYLYADEIGRMFPGDRPAIVGYDAVPRNIALLESDRIDCLISQQPFSQGYNAVQQLCFHQILGIRECVEKHAPVTILFKENLTSYKTIIRERY